MLRIILWYDISNVFTKGQVSEVTRWSRNDLWSKPTLIWMTLTLKIYCFSAMRPRYLKITWKVHLVITFEMPFISRSKDKKFRSCDLWKIQDQFFIVGRFRTLEKFLFTVGQRENWPMVFERLLEPLFEFWFWPQVSHLKANLMYFFCCFMSWPRIRPHLASRAVSK